MATGRMVTFGVPILILVLCPLLTCGYERLGRTTVPIAYHLHLTPNMENYTYRGELRLMVRMNETTEFWLDCDPGLTVSNSSMSFDDEWPVGHTLTRNGSRLHVVAERTMRLAYRVGLNITFTGRISDGLSGFYLSNYTSNGTRRRMASTQFEALGARRAFPCFDEPAFRSRFSIEFSLHPNWTAITNTPLLSDTTSGGVRRMRFAEMASTPVYLVGWAVFEDAGFRASAMSLPTTCGSPVNYTLWSNRDYIGQTQLALNAAPVLVAQLENFTGIKCTAVKDKVDLVAVPDFSAGAMENWGIITFRESGILFDPDYSTPWESQQITMIVSHELAHQWFGNLVTPDWWSFVWLSEGFARYLQYYITNQILPMLQLDKQFLVERRQLALQEDGFSARPMTAGNLETTDDIEDMFDTITYDKGASVIHMMRSVLGDEAFKRGINTYLTNVESAGGVTTPDWFFNSFPSLDPKMRKWTETPGYPVLIVSEDWGKLTIRQVKVTGWNQSEPSDWLVPIWLNIRGNQSLHFLQPNQTIEMALPNNTNYFLNVNQTGYYRVHYENPSRWLSGEADRSALVDDAMALAYSGLLPYRVAMNMALAHLNAAPTDYLLWSSALRALDRLAAILEGTSLESEFNETVLSNLLEKAYLQINNGTQQMANDQLMALHQMKIMRYACRYGLKACLDDANLLARNISNSTPVIRSSLLCTVIREGNQSTWEMIWQRYLSAKSPAESDLMLKSLACTKHRQLIQRFLTLLLTDSIRKHDVESMISLVSSSRIGANEAFAFYRTNYSEIYNRFRDTRKMKKILSAITKNFNDTQLAELKKMATARPDLSFLNSTVSSVEKSVAWKNKVHIQLRSYMTNEPVPTEVPTQPTNPTGITPSSDANSITIKPISLTFTIILLSTSFNVLHYFISIHS